MHRVASGIYLLALEILGQSNISPSRTKKRGAHRVFLYGVMDVGIYIEFAGHARRPAPLGDLTSGLQYAPFGIHGEVARISFLRKACVSLAVCGRARSCIQVRRPRWPSPENRGRKFSGKCPPIEYSLRSTDWSQSSWQG